MRIHPRYLLFCFLVAAAGCTEDVNPPNNQGQDTCVYYPDAQWGTIQYRAYDFTKPCFNPANADEFIYIRYSDSLTAFGYELRKHTISNGQDVVLANPTAATAVMSWDLTGWIYFCDLNNNVWRVQDDGTQLIQFTTCGGMFHPIVNPNGNYVVIEQLCFGPNTQTVVLDNNGIFIDTLADKYVSKVWFNDSMLLYLYPIPDPGHTLCKIISYPSKQIFYTDSFPMQTEYLALLDMNTVGYGDGQLYIYDLTTQQSTVVKSICGDRYIYGAFSYSPLSGKVLSEVRRLERVEGQTEVYSLWRDIIVMDVNGQNAQVIALPQ